MKNGYARKIFFLILILLAQHHALATTTYLGGIDQAIQIAVESSGELRSAQARFGVSQAQVFTANTRLNPVLISDNGLAEDTYRAGLQFIIETASKRKKRTEAAKIVHQITQEEINAKLLDVKAHVRSAYINLYSAREKEKAATEILRTIEHLLEITNKKYESGNISQLDVTQIEIIKINTENELYIARLEIVQAYNELNLLLGYSLDCNCVLEAPILESKFKDIAVLTQEQHDLNIQELEKIAYENRPELKIEQNKIKLAQKQLELAKANRIPNILIAAGPDIVTGENAKTSAFILGAVDIPIFDRKQGPIKEAVALEEHSQKQYEYEKNQILYDVRNAYNRILIETRLVESYKNDLIPKSDDIVYKSRRRFEEGKDGIIVPLLAQESAIKVRFSYIKTMAEYQTAVSDLERAIGTPL